MAMNGPVPFAVPDDDDNYDEVQVWLKLSGSSLNIYHYDIAKAGTGAELHLCVYYVMLTLNLTLTQTERGALVHKASVM